MKHDKDRDEHIQDFLNEIEASRPDKDTKGANGIIQDLMKDLEETLKKGPLFFFPEVQPSFLRLDRALCSRGVGGGTKSRIISHHSRLGFF